MDKLWILGCGGSVSVIRPDRIRYGGATTSVLVRLDGQALLLDAGTGIMNLPEEVMDQPELPLLLSHLHLDHVEGLPMCQYLFQPGRHMPVYSGLHRVLDAEDVLGKLFRPPLWPVTLDELPGKLSYQPVSGRFSLGTLTVETMPGNHPDGVTVFRLNGKAHSVVFATDCTLTPELLPRLTEFARGCDLLLCDGQYSRAEWEFRSFFGHSTWVAAAEFAAACGAKNFRVIHHDPTHSDAVLDAAEAEVRAICPQGRLARQGEEIVL